MGLVLGDYKGTVPITLITQKRGSIGGATPEIAQLRGLRYAVMQEPSKGMKINEGVMKELTGGDPIQGRALFRDTVTFVPQFTLVVCTNHLFDIASNDDGTWRRIRVCDFVSRFVEKPSIVPEDHEFKVDKNISKHFERWVPIFTGMLVEKLKETGGLVKDCDIVMAASQTYKAKQDYFTGFYTERIILDSSSRIKKRDVLNEFTEWYAELYGGKIPKGRELYEFLTKKIGKPTTSGWKGYKLRHSYEDELDIEPNGI
jgi:phage/plasmid-associated DNA primase